MAKAIQTTYKGYRFRSRLEARWAVYFDSWWINWLYEPEGFDLDEVGPYLPDFFLPELNLYVEVKGTLPTKHEMEKCRALAEHTDSAVWLVHGLPVENENYLFAGDTCDSGGGSWEGHANLRIALDAATAWCNDPRTSGDRTLFLGRSSFQNFIDAHYGIECWRSPAARRARFEHGETP